MLFNVVFGLRQVMMHPSNVKRTEYGKSVLTNYPLKGSSNDPNSFGGMSSSVRPMESKAPPSLMQPSMQPSA